MSVDPRLTTMRSHFDRCVEACRVHGEACASLNWALTVLDLPVVAARHHYSETNSNLESQCSRQSRKLKAQCAPDSRLGRRARDRDGVSAEDEFRLASLFDCAHRAGKVAEILFRRGNTHRMEVEAQVDLENLDSHNSLP